MRDIFDRPSSNRL